jgi:hypothetical protein
MFQEYLYSADVVMKNRDKISLSDAQAEKIKKIHSTNAADFSTLKWDLDAATEKLKKLLAETKPDAVAVSKQMDVVLDLENRLKKKQLSTLVAIKNELNLEQQNELQSFKNSNSISGYANSIFSPNTTTSASSNQNVQVRLGSDPDSSPSFYISTKEGLVKITQADLDKINPDDISSIEVKRNQAAIDKVGQDGKNGIVIFILKKGSKYYFQK